MCDGVRGFCLFVSCSNWCGSLINKPLDLGFTQILPDKRLGGGRLRKQMSHDFTAASGHMRFSHGRYLIGSKPVAQLGNP